MYKLTATIDNIQTNESLNIVTFNFNENKLKMMSLDLSDNIKVGTKVLLNIKPSSVAIGKNLAGELSYSNKINVHVKEIEQGELLCNLILTCGDYFLESIITKESSDRMNIKVGDEVVALIKANEISIAEVLS